MSINFIFGLILAMVIGTIISYLATQGADSLIRYIRKRNHCEKNTYLKDWRIVDFDPDIPAVQINAEELTDDEVILDVFLKLVKYIKEKFVQSCLTVHL